MSTPQAGKRLREYETIFLLKADLTDEGVDKVKDRVRSIVTREGGKVLRFSIWGKKRTMYPIAKQSRAIYVHTSYLGASGLVAEVERNLRNLDEVTRFSSVKIAEEIDPETRPVLEDVKLAGDVDESVRPVGAPEHAAAAFRAPVEDIPEVIPPELEDEPVEEA